MHLNKWSIILLATVISLTGCVNMDKQTVGAAVGAIAGGLLGNTVGGGGGRHHSGNIWGAIIGAGVGALAGGQIGRYMDQADKDRAEKLLMQSVQQPKADTYPDSWQSSHGYPIDSRVTTKPEYYENSQRVKKYTQETTVRINGQPQAAIETGVARFEYREGYPNGIWVLYRDK